MFKIIIVLAMLTMTACSHYVIVKECKSVEGEELAVCKTMKPWE